MKNKLCAYKITSYNPELNDKIIGIGLKSWKRNLIGDNDPFKLFLSDDIIPENYVDISSIVTWDSYGCEVANDYLVCKNAIKDIVVETGWNSLIDEEKDIAIKYYAYVDPVHPVIYLMGKGYSQAQAQGFILQQWHIHHANVLKACKQRWYYAKFVVPQFLSFADSEDLMNSVELLIFSYVEMGRLGIEYEDKTDGIMDFIESTNGYKNKGLKEKNYTLINGSIDYLIQGVKNVLVGGLYTKYEDLDVI